MVSKMVLPMQNVTLVPFKYNHNKHSGLSDWILELMSNRCMVVETGRLSFYRADANGRNGWSSVDAHPDARIFFVFNRADDAMLFKLTWMGI